MVLPNQATTFRIDAQTQAISVTVDSNHPAWPLGPGTLAIVPLPPDCDAQSFRAAPGAKLEVISRKGATTELAISSTATSAGELNCGGGVIRPADADIVVTNLNALATAGPVVLRFVGKATAGRDIEVGDVSPPILTGGKVIVESTSAPFPTAKVETDYGLQPGDRVQFLTLPQTAGAYPEQAVSAGLIIITADEGLRILARAKAREASVMRFGKADGEAVALAPTFLTRFQASAEYFIWLPLAWLALKLVEGLLASMRLSITDPKRQQRYVRRILQLLARSAVWLIVLPVALLSSGVLAQDAPKPARIMLDGVTGQALVFRASGSCRALTALHVVEDVDAVRLRFQGGQLAMAERRDSAGDIALLEMARDAAVECGGLPTNAAIQQSLDQNDFQLRQVDMVGLSRVPLSIRSETATLLTFGAMNPADRVRLEKGVSGSPIFAGAIPVAIVTDVNVETGEVLAVRVDAMRGLFPALLDVSSLQAVSDAKGVSAVQSNPATTQPLYLGNLEPFLKGRSVNFASPSRWQAMGPIKGLIQLKDSKLTLARLEFTLDDELLANQPDDRRAVPGVKFQICANVSKLDIEQSTGPLCFSNFKYAAGAKYSTGVGELVYDVSEVCNETQIKNNQCLIWIYYVQDQQNQGQGGSHLLYNLVVTGRVN